MGVSQVHQRVHRDEPAQIRVIGTRPQLGQASGGIDHAIHETTLTRPHTGGTALLTKDRHPTLSDLAEVGVDGDLPGSVM
ncbi:hypothetical protein, partial [Nocardiopsis alkaliphila]|uniref:hypothetical protein n=1 Tax=Nocardiopsis alkaliphila TaxID=225762 RepID=UPI000524F766